MNLLFIILTFHLNTSCFIYFTMYELYRSRSTSEKNVADMSTPVQTVATTLNTCRASRACRARRDERVELCCPTSGTRLDTSRHKFSTPMCGLGSVWCRDVTWRAKWNLNFI